jgi:hypothetical protein
VVPEVLKEGVQIHHAPRNELLQDLLNMGVLGFRLREKNQVALVGPGIEAARLPSTGPRELLFKER